MFTVKRKIIIISAVLILLFSASIVVFASGLLDRNNPSNWIDPNKKNLPNIEDVDKIEVGMEIQEVINILGKPQRDVGSGLIIYEFDLSNGQVLVTFWHVDAEKENQFIKDNPDLKIYGTHFLILSNYKIN